MASEPEKEVDTSVEESYPPVFSPNPSSPNPDFVSEISESPSLALSPTSTSSPGPRKLAHTPNAGKSYTLSTSKAIKSFSFENGGNEGMGKEELKQVETIVYERYIRDLKGISVY